ncbi:nuclear transport factor 2 family protein [Mangrovivirga cuniculi]|uniref:SnoaL-like domain-containing protein n=1 Tax=Mangrovivirga cuniculi TaxID=2715131 RepID=A0A4D7JI46_9BACT|nr:nuclear transport factor 2 family protein [Mangrovivirga cuniculi]QCK15301.1 hypothetical protein DCC35_11365 [Mangrovivirga cuniculi]
MKFSIFTSFLILISLQVQAQNLTPTQERNMELARKFYEDLWFSNNTNKYSDYVADTYVVHDVFERKGVTEPAIEQKEIADFFWENGKMDGEIQFQLVDEDKVATRWLWKYEPETLLGRLMMGDKSIPIINVFRFKDGKIVEFWNHRLDIETNRTHMFTMKGFLYGLLVALIPLFFMIRYKRKLNKLKKQLA